MDLEGTGKSAGLLWGGVHTLLESVQSPGSSAGLLLHPKSWSPSRGTRLLRAGLTARSRSSAPGAVQSWAPVLPEARPPPAARRRLRLPSSPRIPGSLLSLDDRILGSPSALLHPLRQPAEIPDGSSAASGFVATTPSSSEEHPDPELSPVHPHGTPQRRHGSTLQTSTALPHHGPASLCCVLGAPAPRQLRFLHLPPRRGPAAAPSSPRCPPQAR